MLRRSVSVISEDDRHTGMRRKVCEWCGNVFTVYKNVKYAYTWENKQKGRFYFCSWNCMCSAKRANGNADLTGPAPVRIKGGWMRKIE